MQIGGQIIAPTGRQGIHHINSRKFNDWALHCLETLVHDHESKTRMDYSLMMRTMTGDDTWSPNDIGVALRVGSRS